jgi:putative transposase
MGWRETCAVDERMRFVVAVEVQEVAFAAVCRRFGVSRKTGYKWLARYRSEGVVGLGDRSRAPLRHPHAMTDAIGEACLAVRRRHPSWGPAKVRAWLERGAPETAWPAASSIGSLFDREGLTVRRRLRRRVPPSSAPFAACGGANDLWCIDFKGWFLTGDGTHCEPLTLSDAYSRYLLRCQAMGRNDDDHVWPVVAAAFREFGLPKALRSDNGPPFASCGAGGLSKLSVKVIKAGGGPSGLRPASRSRTAGWSGCI